MSARLVGELGQAVGGLAEQPGRRGVTGDLLAGSPYETGTALDPVDLPQEHFQQDHGHDGNDESEPERQGPSSRCRSLMSSGAETGPGCGRGGDDALRRRRQWPRAARAARCRREHR
ncbi:MAG: hypothetical protein WKF73_17185 [Nocardioidaceae bacterium]